MFAKPNLSQKYILNIILGIMTTAETSMFFMKSSCMLFVGGLMVAIAIEHSNLHRYSLKGLLDKFQYRDSNIELYPIAPPLVITLPTLR